MPRRRPSPNKFRTGLKRRLIGGYSARCPAGGVAHPAAHLKHAREGSGNRFVDIGFTLGQHR